MVILNISNTLGFFWKTKTFFKKMENCLLFESPATENATFPNETALPKANAKINRIGIAKWTYDNERDLTLYHVIFLENLISV